MGVPTFGILAFAIAVFGIPIVGIPAFGIPTFGSLVEFRHPLIRHPLGLPQQKLMQQSVNYSGMFFGYATLLQEGQMVHSGFKTPKGRKSARAPLCCKNLCCASRSRTGGKGAVCTGKKGSICHFARALPASNYGTLLSSPSFYQLFGHTRRV